MLSIEIKQSNAAFEEPAETVRILRQLADKVANGCTECSVKDINGNTIGKMTTTDD